MQVNRRDYYNNNIVIIIIIMTYCSVYVHYEQGQPHIFFTFGTFHAISNYFEQASYVQYVKVMYEPHYAAGLRD